MRRVLASALLFIACAPKPADTAGESGSSFGGSEGAEVTSVSDTAPTTGASTTSAAGTVASATDGTTFGSTTFGSTTFGSTTFGSTTNFTAGHDTGATVTGEDTSGGDLPAACANVCAHWEACSPGSAGPLPACMANCINGFEQPAECAAAAAGQWSCVAGLSCEEALKFLNGSPTSCLEEVQVVEVVCFDSGCGGEVGGDMETCQRMQDCGGKQQEYVCDLDVCTCKEDGVAGAVCPSDGFCMLDHDEQRAAITACCGWTWEL